MRLYVLKTYKNLVTMSKTNPTCRRCEIELNDENWYSSSKERHDYICKSCLMDKNKEWYHANLDKARAQKTRANRKHGMEPMNENRECASFLGVHVAEQVLSKVFKNVERMPTNNRGYDFICGKGYKIDVKSSTIHKKRTYWQFHVDRNVVADYFLCIAFDNRDDLNPLHLWLVPGNVINKFRGVSIHPTTIQKWDEYMLDIDSVIKCCDTMKK